MKNIKKIKIGLLVGATLLMSVGTFAFVFASENVHSTSTESVDTKAYIYNIGTSTSFDSTFKNSDVSGTENKSVPITPIALRNTASLMAHNLLIIGEREDGLKDEIQIIVENQNDAGTTTSEAVSKIDNRDGLQAFLFGTDYKNIGVLRSESAKISYQIDALKSLIAKATNAEDIVALNEQISLLQNNEVEIKQFISLHEKQFALFKWFVRYF